MYLTYKSKRLELHRILAQKICRKIEEQSTKTVRKSKEKPPTKK